VTGWKVNADFFPMFGAKMALGRGFLPLEDQPGANRVVILSHSLWQRQFGADKDILGKSVNLEGDLHAVVGILPSGFKVLDEEVDVFTPVALRGAHDRKNEDWKYMAFARLKTRIPLSQAQSELEAIQQRLEIENRREIKGFRPHVWGLRDFMARNIRLSLLVLLAAVSSVLLIACANVAILLLARAGARRQEIAIRTAMGATRGRLLRQLLTECSMLALLGGGFGLLLAHWGIAILSSLRTGGLAGWNQPRLDLPVLGFTLLISLLTGLAFGIAPALIASKTNVHETLKEGGRSATEGSAQYRLRSFLVVSEVALALLLLIGSSLMIRSLLNLQQVNPGFNPSNVLTAAIALPGVKYSKPEQLIAFYQQLEERLQAMPGITAAGLTSVLPLSGSNRGEALIVEGHPISNPSDVPILWCRTVNSRYFQALQIPLRKGRFFSERDAQGAPEVLLINEALSRRYWPGQNPIGKRIGNGRPDGWMTVVGVVGDIHHMKLAAPPAPEIFFPFAQRPQTDMTLTVRTSSDPMRFVPLLRQAVVQLDRQQPVFRIDSLERRRSDSLASNRFSTFLLGIFAAVALLLATLGIYGVISFSVEQRRHDIGIRMALGALNRDVLRMVVGQGVILTMIGIGTGLIAAYALTRVLSSLLFGVNATDPRVFLGVAILFAFVAALASYIPARRAASVDPLVALRHE
jgi:putative ABC transport system permease protein